MTQAETAWRKFLASWCKKDLGEALYFHSMARAADIFDMAVETLLLYDAVENIDPIKLTEMLIANFLELDEKGECPWDVISSDVQDPGNLLERLALSDFQDTLDKFGDPAPIDALPRSKILKALRDALNKVDIGTVEIPQSTYGAVRANAMTTNGVPVEFSVLITPLLLERLPSSLEGNLTVQDRFDQFIKNGSNN
jgi:hypothetical protein